MQILAVREGVNVEKKYEHFYTFGFCPPPHTHKKSVTMFTLFSSTLTPSPMKQFGRNKKKAVVSSVLSELNKTV